MRRHHLLAIYVIGFMLSSLGTIADDIGFNSSAKQGMAGASLAIIDKPERKLFDNPAAVAMVTAPKFATSGLTLRRENLGIGDLGDLFRIGNNGNNELEKTIENIRRFGDHTRTSVMLSSDIGYAVPGVAISAGISGDMRLLCNQDLVNWNTGKSTDVTHAKADAIGMAVVSFPDITMGSMLPTKGQLAVGGRLRVLNAIYTHYYADGNQLNFSYANRAVEMGKDDVLKSHGLGLDLGALYRTHELSPVSYAVLVLNAVEPGIEFPVSPVWAENRNTVSSNSLRPMKRTVNLGTAYKRNRWLAAADVMDIFHNADLTELRVGTEYSISSKFAIRAGYATIGGYAFGLSMGGFGIAITESQPVSLSHQMKF